MGGSATPEYSLTKFYDKTACSSDIFDDGVYCDYSGVQTTAKKLDARTRYNANILGCLDTPGFSMDPKQRHLTRTITYRGRGFYLRANNYLNGLPLFAAKFFPLDNWYDKDVYATTSDGGDAYTKDADFLKACLIYTCLSNQNKCLSFLGSDGREYQNELCFDDSKQKKPIALTDLAKFRLNEGEKELMDLWKKILEEAKKTKNYDSKWNYGVYQITKELNTFEKVGTGSKKQNVYDYPELNGNLNTLRAKLKVYYKKYISEKMFMYELIK